MILEILNEQPHRVVQKHPAVTLTLKDGEIFVRYDVRRCTRCILSEAFPDSDLDGSGECSECRRDPANRIGNPIGECLQTVRNLINGSPAERTHDVLLLYSGGKDSSASLLQLRDFGFRVLAFTVNNGFLADETYGNLCAMTDAAGSDLIVYKPPRALMLSLYTSSLQAPALTQRIKYSTAACGACISFILAAGSLEAAGRRIPLLAGGWTPGQLTSDPLLSGDFLSSVCGNHLPYLRSLESLGGHLSQYDTSATAFPSLFNPLYLATYDETDVIRRLVALGWKYPAGLDSCSSNCRLNSYLVVHHIATHGYHPYEYELAAHVRTGQMSREAALEKIQRIGVSLSALQNLSSLLWNSAT